MLTIEWEGTFASMPKAKFAVADQRSHDPKPR
jgi:hypothetical protein